MDRGQAHTLEAFTAAILLVAGLIFASQATAVTPLSASTSNQHIQNQHEAMANDLLASAAESGDLEDAIIAWDNETDRPYSSGTQLNDTFTDSIENTLGNRSVAYNLQIRWWEDSTATDYSSEEIVTMGTPSDNAVVATRIVPVYAENVENPDEFYIDNASDYKTVYNVVEVRLVVWKM